MQEIDLNNKTILVTGHAGFIGSNLVQRLFAEMECGTIVGIDNMNSYYDPALKRYRLEKLDKAKPAGIDYRSVVGDISDKTLVDRLFAEYGFDVVVNLAAQAGVRYSIENPDAYIQANIIGFYNILEACRGSQGDRRLGRSAQTPVPLTASNYWLATITLDETLRIKGQEKAYKTMVTGAVGGAAGVIHAAESTVTDCQPNDNVEALRIALDQAGIEARPVWKPMHKQPVYKDAPAYINGVSESIFKVGMCLPTGPCVSDEDVEYIVETIKSVIEI